MPLRHYRTGIFAVVIALSTAGGILGLRATAALQRLELMVYDWQTRFVARGPDTDSRIVLIELSESDIQALGTWPLPDRELARTLEIVAEAGARVVGVDVYRDLPVAPGTQELDALLHRMPQVIFPSKLSDGRAPSVGPPAVLAGTQQVGFNNLVEDPDGIIRRGILFMDDGEGGVATSFALLVALYYLYADEIQLAADLDDPEKVRLGPATIPPVAGSSGAYAGIDAGGYQFLADCRSAPAGFESVELRHVLDGSADRGLFEDRIVMLGVTAESLPDLLNYGCAQRPSEPGVSVHAQLTSQLLRLAYGEVGPLRGIADWKEAALTVAWACLGVALGLSVRSVAQLAFFAAGGLAVLAGVGFLGLTQGLWIPIAPAGLAWAVSSAAVTALVTGRERADRRELMQLFARHVDAKIAEQVWRRRDEFLRGGRPRPERIDVTVLFADMRGYTSRAEKLDPEDLVEWLDSYVRELAGCIMDRNGFVVDYFGDGLMSCFGVPIPRTTPEEIRADAVAAVDCALEMGNALQELNQRWCEVGHPDIGLRVGICSGQCVAGDLGSSDRLKYGLVGDVVNTAQRLESLDSSGHDFESQPCRILIGSTTRDLVEGDFEIVEKGEFQVKGKSQSVVAYQVLGHLGDRDGVGRKTSRKAAPTQGEAST